MRYRVKSMGLFLFSLLLISLSLSYMVAWLAFPQDFQMIVGQEENVEILFPFNYYLKSEGLKINGEKRGESLIPLQAREPLLIESKVLGEFNIEFLLFGLLPMHRLVVRVLPQVEVYPGGQSIGVLLNSRGVIIKQHYYVLDEGNEMVYPARDGGLEIGDRILKINGELIQSRYQVTRIVNEVGARDEILQILIEKEDGRREEIHLRPIRDTTKNQYMMGLCLDDGAAGVGTLTFYDEEGRVFGALGHMVTDLYTNERVHLEGGEIIAAEITGINAARRGLPGEKLGVFLEEAKVLGEIHKNTPFGIFGELHERPVTHLLSHPVPVATGIQVYPGPAEIYTVLEGDTVERFHIEILRIRQQSGPSSKGLVLRIVDDRLLEKTGGIVQGMSGSPILQEGRLVGAITHVFVNDPKRGYGVLAEWMIYESGILEEEVAGWELLPAC